MKLGIGKLVKQKPKTAAELVSKSVKCWNVWFNSITTNHTEPLPEGTVRCLHQMKELLYGDNDTEVNQDIEAELIVEICKTDLLMYLCHFICMLNFEVRKEAVLVFAACVRRPIYGRYLGVEYVQKHPNILELLAKGYEDAPLALNYGAMFRHCLFIEPLCRMVLLSGLLYGLFDHAQAAHFHIASDAFSSMQDALTRHKALVSTYLRQHCSEFFSHYHKLLTSHNYVTRRRSVVLFREILKENKQVMAQFVSSAANLRTIMKLLKDSSRNIQTEAMQFFMDALNLYPGVTTSFLRQHHDEFAGACINLLQGQNPTTRHQAVLLLRQLLSSPDCDFFKTPFISDVTNLMLVMNLMRDSCEDVQFEAFYAFKEFVAHPSKPRLMVDILLDNKDKLLRYLTNFHVERDDDDPQFHAAKVQILELVTEMQ